MVATVSLLLKQLKVSWIIYGLYVHYGLILS